MDILSIYNTIVYYLGLVVPDKYIELIGLFGIILATYGAFLLVKPLVKSNAEIKAISSYKNDSLWGQGKKIEVNSSLKKSLEEDRQIAFSGAMYIFIGFTLQLLEKSINIAYPNKALPNGINWFFFLILMVAFTIMIYNYIKKMELKKKSYEEGNENKIKEQKKPTKNTKKNISKISHFYQIILVAIFLLLVSGIFMVKYSSSIDEYPKYESPSFAIFARSTDGEIVNFTSFRTNYHFDEKRGTFSFVPGGNLSKLTMDFPKSFNITSVEYMGEPYKQPFPFKYEKLTDKWASIIFLNETNDKWLFVNFDIELSPNARFDFWKNSIWENNDNFYFDMGNEFECTRQDCFFNLVNVKIDRSHLGTQQERSSSVAFVNQVVESERSVRHEFELSARSRTALTSKAFWAALGSSIIAGSIFALFSLIIAIYQDSNKQNKK